jgi:hypothetical protein
MPPTLLLLIRNIFQHLLHYSRKKISFLWIPGYQKIPGNEFSDQIAKSAFESKNKYPQITCNRSLKILKSINFTYVKDYTPKDTKLTPLTFRYRRNYVIDPDTQEIFFIQIVKE